MVHTPGVHIPGAHILCKDKSVKPRKANFSHETFPKALFLFLSHSLSLCCLNASWVVAVLWVDNIVVACT